MNRRTGSAVQQGDPHTGKHRGTLLPTESHGQNCPCWQILFPLGCVYRTNLLNMYSTPLWPVQMLVWRHRWHLCAVMLSSQEPFAHEPLKPCQTQPCFSQDIFCSLYSCSQKHSNRRAQLIQFLWVAPAVLSNALLLLLSKRGERNDKALSDGAVALSYLPTPTKVMFVIIWRLQPGVFLL